jgi:hypothetical protein
MANIVEKLTADQKSDTLENIHREKTSGKVSDKWESYLKVYDRTFAPLRDKKISLLEIGVQNGGSLEVWSKYFKNAEAIVGCDINPLCRNLSYQDPRIHLVVGDANAAEIIKTVTQISPRFDVIVDDGSHVSDDIINSFNLYFPLVQPGGIYVVEDTHTLYYKSHGGGLERKKTATTFFKLFADLVNYEHWDSKKTIEELLGNFASDSKLPEELKAGWVESVEFRNSLIIIRKELVPTHAKLGSRLIVGTDAAVVNLKASVEQAASTKVWKSPKKWF